MKNEKGDPLTWSISYLLGVGTLISKVIRVFSYMKRPHIRLWSFPTFDCSGWHDEFDLFPMINAPRISRKLPGNVLGRMRRIPNSLRNPTSATSKPKGIPS